MKSTLARVLRDVWDCTLRRMYATYLIVASFLTDQLEGHPRPHGYNQHLPNCVQAGYVVTRERYFVTLRRYNAVLSPILSSRMAAMCCRWFLLRTVTNSTERNVVSILNEPNKIVVFPMSVTALWSSWYCHQGGVGSIGTLSGYHRYRCIVPTSGL